MFLLFRVPFLTLLPGLMGLFYGFSGGLGLWNAWDG